ncbi:C39 family peptidase [Sediminibacillus albus]|uniref:Uncharacterized protein YvpB n=1 Tax=Sediminibacillus albus TaxID=407036 RepID=A0A1G8ZZ03_9BACI|nr:Uncharacterized protein YvpB [Sediminibacillus albus]
MITLKKILILVPAFCLAGALFLWIIGESQSKASDKKVKALTQESPKIIETEAAFQINGQPVRSNVLGRQGKYYLPVDPILAFEGTMEIDYDHFLRIATVTQEEETHHFSQLPASNQQERVEAIFSQTTGMQQVITYDNQIYATPAFLNQLDFLIKKEEGEDAPLFSIDIPEEKAELPLDVPLMLQMAAPRLYNGCEVTSLAMILDYHGIEVSKNELAENIETVPLNYGNGLKGDPNDGFVGNMADGPGLGVYHGPVWELAKQYVGNRAIDLTGSEIEAIYQSLDKGQPVWVITTSSFAPVNSFEAWETPNGEVEVTFALHSVVVTGYDEDFVYINDPYGGKNKKVDRENFENAWVQMGRQAITITN